jgi:mannitol-specific phosphotransferase system IIBC component
MNKNIIREMFNILFNSFSSNIVGFLISIIIVVIPIGIIWGIYLLLEHFFGVMAAGYTFLGFCTLGGLFILLDATISWIKNTYRQAKKNIEYKR